jgi:hypothetical protein
LYRTDGSIRSFARLSGLGGELRDINANEASTEGPVVIDVKLTDVAFQSSGDGVWHLVDESYQPVPLSSFGDG